MDHRGDWIKAFRQHLKDKKQETFGERFGVSQTTVSRWEDGAEPRLEHWTAMETLALARGFKLPYTSSKRMAKLRGFVGAGATIIPFGDGQGPFGEVEMPPDGTDATVAVEVRGDSMGAEAANGSTIYYDDRREPPTEDLFGRLCVIGLADERVMVKRLVRGRKPGHYDLYSTNGEPLLDQPVIWAARVTWIKPG